MSKLDEYKFKDRLIKGISDQGDFKISVVKTTELVQEAVERHQLGVLSSVLLGRTLTASLLLASELKGEERIQLRFDGDGPVGMILAEANSVGEVRGYVRHPQATLSEDALLDQEPRTIAGIGLGLGIGVLNVSKTLYNEAEPRNSSIEIINGDITQDIAYYLTQSEQIPSAVMLDISLNEQGEILQAGGLLIQRLPGAKENVMDRLSESLKNFPSISSLLENEEYIDAIMHKAAGDFGARELDRRPVHFFCRCSRERFIRGLAMLSYNELKELEGEAQELVCQYCGTTERITEGEIAQLALEAKAALN